jgi:hypothetical protein
MRRLTVKLMRCLVVSIDDGGECMFADSGELLQKKSVKFSWLRLSLDVPLHRQDPEDEALLLDHLWKFVLVSTIGLMEKLR